MSDMELDLQLDETTTSPVDEERARVREEYRLRLAEKLKDPEFRKIEGFPIGTDEAILALSDPPFYTACPNPFVEQLLKEFSNRYVDGTDNYHREPFAADVSEGKSDPIYNAHSYHTKVPHKAIMRYILHYTEPGDVVYDGFCGTGMTGVAAQLCGNKYQVESLGYKVLDDGSVVDTTGVKFGTIGPRVALLNDLSPAATFIAHNYNSSVDILSIEDTARNALKKTVKECGWLYITLHDIPEDIEDEIVMQIDLCNTADEVKSVISMLTDEKQKNNIKTGQINHTIWSDVLICPACGGEIVYWDAVVDEEAGNTRDSIICEHCTADVSKKQCEKSIDTHYDNSINEVVQNVKRVPVLVSYKVGKLKVERRPSKFDLAMIKKISSLTIPYWYPTNLMMGKGDHWGDTWRAGVHFGITHTHHFYTYRNLWVLATIWNIICAQPFMEQSSRIQFAFTAMLRAVSRLASIAFSYYFNGGGGAINAGTKGTLYVSSYIPEINVINSFESRISSMKFNVYSGIDPIIETASATSSSLPDSSVDYIFSDPPFGGVQMYSELNYLWESWLRVVTESKVEAVKSDTQNKGIHEYLEIMTKCFSEHYRVLKPGHWMTIKFHNSENSVWNAIQEAIDKVGFVIADVRVLDKRHSTIMQVTTKSVVKQDLIIACYKPHSSFEMRFQILKGKPEGVLEFIRQHLSMLPIAPITKNERIETVAERTRYLLFDRMVAYHLQHGARIPLSASDFYQMLNDQFVERDDMYFLQDQAAKYDALRARTEVEQLSIFIRDEKSAVQWVRTQLFQSPQTLGDLTPKFMQETRDWEAHEPRPELRDLLKENFILDNNDIWRVPDPNQEKDLEALRRKGLLRTFEGYVRTKGVLKIFRKEAIIEGFKHCWQTRQLGVIVAVCESIPMKILQEVPEFVQFYDIAKDLAPAETQQLEFTWEG